MIPKLQRSPSEQNRHTRGLWTGAAVLRTAIAGRPRPGRDQTGAHRPGLPFRAALLGFHFVAMACLNAGCPEIESEPPPPATCTKLYQRCQLPEGPLGVCEQKGLNDRSLVCRSQH